MKRFTFFIVFLFCLNCVYSQQSNDQLWERALNLRDNGNFQQALDILIEIQSTKDPDYYDDCELMIQQIKSRLSSSSNKQSAFILSKEDIILPYRIGSDSIEVSSNKKSLNIDNDSDWLEVKYLDNKIYLTCISENESISERTTLLKVYNDQLTKYIKIVQLGSPEYLTIKESTLELKDNKERYVFLDVFSNADWLVQHKPDWCNVEVVDSGINILVQENPHRYEREGKLILTSLTKESELVIKQPAAQTFLITSADTIAFESDGGHSLVCVITNSADWFVTDYPRWLEVKKVGNDTLVINCNQNIPNGEIRHDNIQIKADNLINSIYVHQDAKTINSVLFPNDKVISGRNISYGASLIMSKPLLQTEINGSYLGTVVDYSLDITNNADYYDATMFGFGFITDMRLYKNLFLQIELDFLNTTYRNKIKQFSDYICNYGGGSTYSRGNAYHVYNEKYNFQTIELPILFSWCWKINDISHMKIFAGPSIQYGLKANLELSGTTESKQMNLYYSNTNTLVDNYAREIKIRAESSFDLYTPYVEWNIIDCVTANSEVPINQNMSFSSSPYKNLNYFLQIGFGYEFLGFALNLKYSIMLNNMANSQYWSEKRWTILGGSGKSMYGYKQYIHYLGLNLSYVLRY